MILPNFFYTKITDNILINGFTHASKLKTFIIPKCIDKLKINTLFYYNKYDLCYYIWSYIIMKYIDKKL